MLTFKDIPNHFSFDDVYDIAVRSAPDPAVFAEIGTWLGASTVYMADSIKQLGKRIEFYAIDNFTAEGSRPKLRAQAMQLGGDFYKIFCSNLERCGVSKYVKPVRGDSTASAGKFADKSLDFVYIDACHDYEKVRQDILAWLPKIKPNGVIAGHDYDSSHRELTQAVHEIFGPDKITVLRHSWIFPVSSNESTSWWPISAG